MALSILINFLSLPLYRKADQLQREEIEKVKKMNHWLTHIKKHFSGDERFMMQSAYYRIEHYNPLGVLREAGPLILQVPFFIAAYRFISSITLLKGAAFGPIHDLSSPDGLFTIAGYNINILPIIMTMINSISGYIYSKNSLLKQKIQIYGLALLFLILLYDSPSGLVIYWIMNNIFSLCKNIYFHLQARYQKIFPTIGAVLLVILITCCMLNSSIDSLTDIVLSECIMMYAIIRILITTLHLKQVKHSSILTLHNEKYAFNKSIMPSQILLAELCMSLLLGFYIPSSVIASSPVEFVDKSSGTFQSNLLIYPAAVYTGLFLLWMTVIILSRDGKKRIALALGLCFLMGIALFNQFFAPAQTGTLYSDLSFDGALSFSMKEILYNILFGLLISSVLGYIFIYKPKLSKRITLIISATLFFLFVRNLWVINTELNRAQVNSEKTKTYTPITLSKNKKNVVVMMLDRAIGGYVPYIFDEKPELKESYQGFVYYPNTI
ncbi:MAG: YidC/Oxa1 family membrane protein insertase, partial [bacterium]|nr:YidC/Oxa1 family membrane protein insertase [bacterium]